MNAPNPEYIRLCPSCGGENDAGVMRCGCGAMLFGLDLVKRQSATVAAAPSAVAIPADTVSCPHEDCGQQNPAGTQICLYCNRSLAVGAPMETTQSLINLPAPLQSRYRIVKSLPANGAEAEIVLVEPVGGGEQRIAKIYRQGIQPKAEVQERIAAVDAKHRVTVLEAGRANGYAYEVMEYCAFGSLRERVGAPWPPDAFIPVVTQIADALVAVHAAGIVHRDLKPDNILVRAKKPLDLVLTDFGIASVLNSSQCFTSMARTLLYASPESLSGVIDGKADYWSLGMLLCEAALGKHPFAGLSDAVILHHLTTRSMDLDGVADPRVRNLLRGLLIRDPARRWGDAEIRRWLRGDATLTAPEDDTEDSFAEPYMVGSERCRTPVQLATAFSRNWSAGISDLNNAQLLRWFRDVQKDHNVVRLLLDMRSDALLPVDVQLLRVLLHLAPGMPPVWRGESIELRAILTRANLALKGDADAARWLGTLYNNRVLDLYATAGNPEAAELAERWTGWANKFTEAWEAQQALIKSRAPARNPNDVVLFDDVVYGRKIIGHPSLLALHPRLLAMAYDSGWAERLRQRLVAEQASLVVTCPWLAEVGDPATMNPAALLAFEALLPEARLSVEQQQKRDTQQKQVAETESRTLKMDAEFLLPRLRATTRASLITEDNRQRLRETLDDYFRILTRLRESAETMPEWERLKTTYNRISPIAIRILESLDGLDERQTANAGWLDTNTIVGAGLSLFVSAAFISAKLLIIGLIAIIGIALWRTLPSWAIRSRIRTLARSLDQIRSTSAASS